MSSPPVYEAGPISASDSLPAYSPRAGNRRHRSGGSSGSTEHVFSLEDKKNKMHATMKLFSSAPTSNSLPTFMEGDKINGSLELDIPNNEKIAGVSIFVRGEIITGPQRRDRSCFLDIQIPLWSKASAGTAGALSSGCRWPFSFDIPKDVVLADPKKSGAVRSYVLPQTFLERNAKVSAHYYLSAQITRSAFLFREYPELQTMFVYVPAIRPDPPSPLRKLAYQQNMPIPGPESDAQGWQTFPVVTVKGTVFNNRPVEVQCLFSLCKPVWVVVCATGTLTFSQLSYTRGSVIPCSATYFCRDLQALNLLCTPASIDVRLHRQVKCTSITPGGRDVDDMEESGRAVWWPVTDAQDNRSFSGEIHLAKTLKPTSAISAFALKYFVVVMPFLATGFSASTTEPLIRQEVQIATILPRGPKPRCSTVHPVNTRPTSSRSHDGLDASFWH
ncbi:hypothetical protein DFH06DRAFT_1304647 [Mycena polygramma]|nr:hypothetical protein DFH06DRAFT_1306621 [Mycena polygramma]KAJ7626545.1 hypothetical protein DFH06DRAFT_1304647 [Mycena polygramma]